MIIKKLLTACLLIAMMVGVVVADPFGINQHSASHLSIDISDSFSNTSNH